jgi:glycosidase
MIRKIVALFLLALFSTPLAAQPFKPVSWVKNATIYEVNIRQYTPEGTIKAFEKHLPRLQKMGVKILWIMPVQPIGKENRKGGLGSYYSIQDYKGINPEFGTHADFKAMVAKAQGMGFKVILDWVANHTAWDHPWVKAHPERYKKDKDGKIVSVNFPNGNEIEYWTDVVALDYSQPDVPAAMIDAMTFWVKDMGIDGFRCDVAGLVPLDFWIKARREIDAVRPMFWLAEWGDPKMHQAFDMSYHWDLSNTFRDIVKGKATADNLRALYAQPTTTFPKNAIRMIFTSNHDYNSWHGTDQELYGPGFKAFAVLAATLPGMPLIYSGQESGLNKRLAFFEKDQIDWGTYPHTAFYTRLMKLNRTHPAMVNDASATFRIIDTGNPAIFAFERRKGRRSVAVTANLSGAVQADLKPWDTKIVEK